MARDGTRINGTALTTLLYGVEGIRRYQYRQIARDRLVLAVEPINGQGGDAVALTMEDALRKLRAILNGIEVELQIVGEILPSPSGKYRYVINEIRDG